MNSTTSAATNQCSFLIVGYGNELRGDDGVGPQVAMAILDWHLPSVKSLSVYLPPQALATARRVLGTPCAAVRAFALA